MWGTAKLTVNVSEALASPEQRAAENRGWGGWSAWGNGSCGWLAGLFWCKTDTELWPLAVNQLTFCFTPWTGQEPNLCIWSQDLHPFYTPVLCSLLKRCLVIANLSIFWSADLQDDKHGISQDVESAAAVWPLLIIKGSSVAFCTLKSKTLCMHLALH